MIICGGVSMASTTGRKKNTRGKILEVAVELYATKGYTQTTLREISAAAGIKASSIYNHFESKEAILDVIYEEYMSWTMNTTRTEDEVAEAIKAFKDGREVTPEALLELFYYKYPDNEAIKYRNMLRIVYFETNNNENLMQLKHSIYSEDSVEFVKDVFQRMVDDGTLHIRDVSAAACSFSSVLLSFIYLYTMDINQMDKYGGHNSVEDIMKYTLQLIIDGKM